MSEQEGPPFQELPSAGPERVIFLRALRKFSDECEPPELQPDCPFSVDLPDGGRGCAEECMDILAQYGDSYSRGGGVDLGNGIVVTRRPRPLRPRRGPEIGSRPFDAEAVLARDRHSGRPISAWNTVSLVRVLLNELPRSPVGSDAERTSKIINAWDELERRGHNVEGYVRWGRGRFIATSIIIATILPYLEEVRQEQEAITSPETLREAPPGWANLLAEMHAPDPRLDEAFASLPSEERARISQVIGALGGPFATLTNAWVRIASRDDLIAWRSPSDPKEVLTLGAIETVATEERATYAWMVDRFAYTYLSDWAKDSLYLEWRYLHAEVVAPCSRKEMGQRRIAEAEVSKAIAGRVASVLRNPQHVAEDDESRQAPGLSIDQLTGAAIEFLEAGRRTAAAALFEAAKRDYPNNGVVRNNYGFCILPDHPQDGLQEIHAASELGLGQRSITLANRMYGLFRLRRFTSALEAAESLFQEEDAPLSAYLWDWRKEPENATIVKIRPRQYAVEFALDIAQRVGDLPQINLWVGRAELMGIGSDP
jgi:hypothetical protein